MPTPSAYDRFTDWLREHGTGLAGLDPDAPTVDLDPLRTSSVTPGSSPWMRILTSSVSSLARHRVLHTSSNGADSRFTPSSSASARRSRSMRGSKAPPTAISTRAFRLGDPVGNPGVATMAA